MSTNEVVSKDGTRDASLARLDLKLEAVVIPVADVDRAKEFFGKLGWARVAGATVTGAGRSRFTCS